MITLGTIGITDLNLLKSEKQMYIRKIRESVGDVELLLAARELKKVLLQIEEMERNNE